MTKKNVYVTLYERLSALITNLSEDERQRLEAGVLDLKIQLIDKGSNKRESPRSSTKNELSVDSVIDRLNRYNDRLEGMRFLESRFKVRNELVLVARKMDIPVSKKDTIDKLKAKIIEGTIGFRLRSQAIQNREAEK